GELTQGPLYLNGFQQSLYVGNPDERGIDDCSAHRAAARVDRGPRVAGKKEKHPWLPSQRPKELRCGPPHGADSTAVFGRRKSIFETSSNRTMSLMKETNLS